MSIVGARIQRVDQPSPYLICLTLGPRAEKQTLALEILPQGLRVALLPARPKGDAATPTLTKFRAHLKGARIQGLKGNTNTIQLQVARGDEKASLIALPSGLLLRDAEHRNLVASNEHLLHRLVHTDRLPELQDTDLQTQLDDFMDTHLARVLDAQKKPILAVLRRAKKKAEKRRRAIEADIAKTNLAENIRKKAEFLLSNLHAIKEGQSVVEVKDWSANPPRIIPIELDMSMNASLLANKWFAKAKKLERGRPIAEERLKLTDNRISEIESILRSLPGATSDEVDVFRSDAAALGATSWSGTQRSQKRKQDRRKPYRLFYSEIQTPIYVGRGAKDNDALTTKHARPHDLWLHTKDSPGAHVVVRLERGHECNPATLLDAATLAAHFSELKQQANVAVSYTEARYVNKRKGSPVGSVSIRKEKVIVVKMETARIERLFQSNTLSINRNR